MSAPSYLVKVLYDSIPLLWPVRRDFANGLILLLPLSVLVLFLEARSSTVTLFFSSSPMTSVYLNLDSLSESYSLDMIYEELIDDVDEFYFFLVSRSSSLLSSAAIELNISSLFSTWSI